MHGACRVIVTDYPDAELIENLRHNISTTCQDNDSITAEGYLWGADPDNLLSHLTQSPCGRIEPLSGGQGFDTLILADLLFNHSCHNALLKTVSLTLAQKPGANALVFFTPYRPWLLHRDMAFFDIVEADGRFDFKRLGEWRLDKVMFEDDPGDESLRRTVFGYQVSWRDRFLSRGGR